MKKLIPAGAILALALTPFTFAQNTPAQSPPDQTATPQGSQTSTGSAPAKKQKKKKKNKGANSEMNGGSATGTGNTGSGSSSGSTTNPPTSR